MKDGEPGNGACRGHGDDILALALKALSVLASRKLGSGSAAETEAQRIQEMCDAFVHEDEKRRYVVLSKLIANGVTSEEIVERYVPLAAMRLGEGWVDGTRSFSEVSIGAARLQETIRALDERGCSVAATVPLGHRILIVIPDHEDHTLGAFIAAGQFRRYGLWVHMAIGQSDEEVAALVANGGFGMIGVSGAGRKALEPVKRLVDKLRRSLQPISPIVIGGNVCNLGLDVCSCTGADLATTSPRQALDFCGLNVSPDLSGTLVA